MAIDDSKFLHETVEAQYNDSIFLLNLGIETALKPSHLLRPFAVRSTV